MRAIALIWTLHYVVNGQLIEEPTSPRYTSFEVCQSELPMLTTLTWVCWPHGLK